MEWISVNDKSPDNYISVLCSVKIYINGEHMDSELITSFKNDKNIWFHNLKNTEDIITYWQPLPEPPVE